MTSEKIIKEIENFILIEIKIWLKENWQKPFGFLSLLTVCFIPIIIFEHKFIFLHISLLQNLLSISKWVIYISILSISYLIIFFIIYQKVKYPITPKNKTGIFIAISNKFGDRESTSFINKIYKEVDSELRSLGFGDVFYVVKLDEYKSQKIICGDRNFWDPTINKTKWKPNLNNSRWNFLLYGTLKNARHGEENNYKLEPEYAVTHDLIDGATSFGMGKNWNEFLKTQKWEFPLSQEMQALEVTAENIKENILFSLGSSAYVSGLINVAIIFHEKLFNLINPRVKHESNLRNTHNIIKTLLTIENNLIGNYFLKQNDLNSAISFQEKALIYNPNYYWAHLNLAHHYYTKGESYEDKVDFHINQAEKYSVDASFKLSKAFLLMDRDKKFKEGVDLYIETLRRGVIREDIIKGTLSFIEEEIKNTSKAYPLFIKGLIYKFKINEDKSKEIFKEFIRKNEQNTELFYLIEKSKVYSQN